MTTTLEYPAPTTVMTSVQTDALSNVTSAMDWLPNVTSPTLPVCSMTSLDINVTKSTNSATGASIVSPIVMFLAGVVGNVLALVVLHRSKKETRSMKFYTLVAALTWNDLIGILLTSPIPMATYINHRQMPAVDKLCRFHGFVMVCFGLSTPLIVCSMAVERSLALKCPYFYFKYCNPGSARILVVVLWAFVLLFGALPLFGLGSYSLQYPCTWCFLDFRSGQALDMTYAYAYAVLNLVVVVVMIFCNAVVMTTLCQVRQVRRKLSVSASQNNSTALLNNYGTGVGAAGDATGGGANMTGDEKTLRTVMTQQQQLQLQQQQQPASQFLAQQAPQHVRRRNQRDVELQMIWLLCAITTIFSVCWVPLMAYILFSLQSEENHAPVFGLVAVRLASLNQTINPWIYVILRKSLLARIRRFCCYATSCLDNDQEHHLPRRAVPPPYLYAAGQGQGRRQGYVHVRQQLCPSSQFVGQKQNGSLSQSDGHSGGHCKGSKGSGSSNKGNKKGRGGGAGDWGNSYASDSWTSGDRFRGGGSSGLCSVCRLRLVRAVEDGDINDFRSLTSSSGSPPSSRCASRRCGAASNGGVVGVSCGGGSGRGEPACCNSSSSRFTAPLASSSSSASCRGGGAGGRGGGGGGRGGGETDGGGGGNGRRSASAARCSSTVMAACRNEEEEDLQSEDPSARLLKDSSSCSSHRQNGSGDTGNNNNNDATARPQAEPLDGMYVDLFRQLPPTTTATSSTPTRSEPPLRSSSSSKPAARGGGGEVTSQDNNNTNKDRTNRKDNNTASHRSSVERFFMEAAAEAEAEAAEEEESENDRAATERQVTSNINTVSIISEGDDHGYVSKVSTDSSRNSSPENRRGMASSEREAQPAAFTSTTATTTTNSSPKDALPPPPHNSHHRHHHHHHHHHNVDTSALIKPDRRLQRSAGEDIGELGGLNCARRTPSAKSSSVGSTCSTCSGSGNKTDRKSTSSLGCTALHSASADRSPRPQSTGASSSSAAALALRGKTGSDDSFELSSGVFHSHDDPDVCDDVSTDVTESGAALRNGVGGDDGCGDREEVAGGEGRRAGRCSGSRTVSSSSAGTFTESSSGHEGAGRASLSVQNGVGNF